MRDTTWFYWSDSIPLFKGRISLSKAKNPYSMELVSFFLCGLAPNFSSVRAPTGREKGVALYICVIPSPA